MPFLNTCLALTKPISRDKSISVVVLLIIVLGILNSMVSVQGQEQVTSDQATILGETLDVMVID